MSTDTTFKITNTKLYVPTVTLSSKDNVKLAKIETRNSDENNLATFPLDASFQGVRRLFVLAFDNTDNDTKKVERKSHKIFSPKSKYN